MMAAQSLLTKGYRIIIDNPVLICTKQFTSSKHFSKHSFFFLTLHTTSSSPCNECLFAFHHLYLWAQMSGAHPWDWWPRSTRVQRGACRGPRVWAMTARAITNSINYFLHSTGLPNALQQLGIMICGRSKNSNFYAMLNTLTFLWL